MALSTLLLFSFKKKIKKRFFSLIKKQKNGGNTIRYLFFYLLFQSQLTGSFTDWETFSTICWVISNKWNSSWISQKIKLTFSTKKFPNWIKKGNADCNDFSIYKTKWNVVAIFWGILLEDDKVCLTLVEIRWSVKTRTRMDVRTKRSTRLKTAIRIIKEKATSTESSLLKGETSRCFIHIFCPARQNNNSSS